MPWDEDELGVIILFKNIFLSYFNDEIILFYFII